MERFTFTIPGRPVPAARMTQGQVARLRAGKPIRDQQVVRYLAWKDTVGWEAKQQGAEPLSGRLWIRVWIYLNRRGQGDIDNFAKGICDGLKSVAWGDDAQVDELVVRIRTGVEDEHVDVEIRRIA